MGDPPPSKGQPSTREQDKSNLQLSTSIIPHFPHLVKNYFLPKTSKILKNVSRETFHRKFYQKKIEKHAKCLCLHLTKPRPPSILKLQATLCSQKSKN